MGCGKQFSNKGCPEILIIRNDLQQRPELIVQNIENFSIIQNPRSFVPSNLTSFLSHDKGAELKNDGLDEISKISVKDKESIKAIKLTFKSHSEVSQNCENSGSGSIAFNFEFLSESSNINSNVQRMIDEVLNDLTDGVEVSFANSEVII